MLRRILIAGLLIILAAPLGHAHDTWIEKRDGQFLVLRGHGGSVEAYDTSLVKESKARDAKGQAIEVEIKKNKENAALLFAGNAVVIAALYDSGYWLHTTDGWKKAGKREGKGKYDIVEALKSKQWCKSYLAPGEQNLKPVGQRYEVLPLKDPVTLHVGDELAIKVVFDGKPVEGAIITTGGAHASDEKNSPKTGKDGTARVTIKKAGLQLIKATQKVPLKDDPDADVLHLASTMTFVAK